MARAPAAKRSGAKVVAPPPLAGIAVLPQRLELERARARGRRGLAPRRKVRRHGGRSTCLAMRSPSRLTERPTASVPNVVTERGVRDRRRHLEPSPGDGVHRQARTRDGHRALRHERAGDGLGRLHRELEGVPHLAPGSDRADAVDVPRDEVSTSASPEGAAGASEVHARSGPQRPQRRARQRLYPRAEIGWRNVQPRARRRSGTRRLHGGSAPDAEAATARRRPAAKSSILPNAPRPCACPAPRPCPWPR